MPSAAASNLPLRQPQLLLGHSTQRAALRRLITRGRLPSTLIFAGPAGIGKQLVAREVAASLICQQPDNGSACGNCSACLLFASAAYPDFMSFRCSDRETWDVAQARELLRRLSFTSFSGQARVILLNDADYMGDPSVNVLLKALEEPRPRTYFFLIASNPSRFPSPLLSRCQRWSFGPLLDPDIRTIIGSKVAAIDNLEHLVTLCDGSLDGLDSLQASAEEWKLVSELLDGLATGALADAPKIAQAWAKQRDQISLRLRFCRLYARQRMQTYINSTRTENSALMAACWAYLLQNAITAERLIFERNLNANAVLCLLLSTCAEIARLPNLVFVEPHKHLLQEVVV